MPRCSWVFVCLILSINACHGHSFSGMSARRHAYSVGEVIHAEVSPLTSPNTELPLSYYTLPYCKPPQGVKKSVMNLGQVLMGDRVENSPYRFKMNVNETVFLCTIGPLTAHEVELLRQGARERYHVNMVLDSLPVTMFSKGILRTGVPVGYTAILGDDVYLINHLRFRVFIHELRGSDSGFEIVRFEVDPCSVKHNLNDTSELHMYDNTNVMCHLVAEKVVRENETIVLSYEVEFVKSDITWPSRWDVYSQIDNVEFRDSILFPVLMFFILQVFAHVRLRTVVRDRNGYEELGDNEGGHLNEAASGWRLVSGDAFREPECAKLLCVMVGAGVQITATFVVAIVLFSLGYVSPVSRGAIPTSSIMLYLFFSIASGYASVRLWRTIKGTSEGWKWVSLYAACFFPGIAFSVLAFSNVVFLGAKSTRAIPVSIFLILVSIWFCISVPLTLVGGFVGTTKLAKPLVRYPIQTNHTVRQVPVRKFPMLRPLKSPSWLHVLVVGFALFFILEKEPSSFTLSRVLSIWQGSFYSAVRDLNILLLMFVVFCAEESVVSTYTRLRLEDWRWWWKAFFTSGSVGMYVFLDSIINLVLVYTQDGSSGPASATLYVGYSLIVAVGAMLAMGSIGFLVSFYFVHYLYSSVKMSC